MSDTKTGNKGFVVDGKVYHIDQVPVGDDGINIDDNLKLLDPGSINVDNTVKDIGKKTRITLGTYLSKATKGEVGSATVSNKYPIDAPTDASQTSKIVEGGYPAPISPTTNSSKFAGNLPSSFSEDYSALQGAQGDFKIKKGLSSAVGKDGNELLPGVSPNTNTVTVISKYQTYSFVPNYREPGTNFSTEDILNPSSGFNPALLNYTKISFAPNPNDTTVAVSNLSLRLKKVAAATDTSVFNFASGLTGKNFFSVSAPDPLTLTSITDSTKGVPPALAKAENQNTKIFVSGLRDSYTADYTTLDVNNQSGLQKGKTEHSISSAAPKPSGNSFLSKIVIEGTSIKDVNGLKFLKDYTSATILPNYRNSEDLGQFTTEDILSPSGKFDYKLIDYSSLQKVEPKTEAVKQDDLTLTLSNVFNFASKLTDPSDGFISLTTSVKNVYPVKTKPDNPEIVSLSVNDRPSPLSSAESQNEDSAFAGTLDSSFTKNYPEISGKFQKGKSFDKPDNPDGNDLLPSAAEKAPVGGSYVKNATKLNDPIQTYTQSVVEDNTFKDAVGSLQSNKFLDSSVDASAPPPNFEPKINDVPAASFGTYSDTTKDPVALKELRQKAIDVTAGNKYKLYTKLDQLSSTTDQSTGLPSPLTSTNTNSYVTSNQIKPESSDASLTDAGFSKGKTKAPYDGHNLLPDVGGNLNVVDDRFSHPHGRPGLSYEIGGDGNATIEDFGTTKDDTTPNDHPLKKYTSVLDGNNTRLSAILSAGNNRWAARAGASKGFNPKLKIPDSESPSGFSEVSHLRMAKIGTGLLQRASGESPARIEGAKFNPTGADAEGRALVPSGVQLGITKVNYATLTAQDVFRHLSEGEEDVDSLINIARGLSGDDESWGATNSSSEPYDDGLSNIGAATTMLLMVVAIATLYEIFGLVGDNTRADTKDGNGQYVKGKYLFEKQSGPGFFSFMPNAYEIFGIRKTNNNYRKSLATGAKAFFTGSEKPNTSLAELITTLAGAGVDSLIGENSIVNANLVVCRTIVRSALVFAIAIDSLIRRSQNPATGFKNSISFLSVWRSSKLVASMNTFSALGDALLDRQSSTRKVIGPDGKELIFTPIDEIPVRYHASLEAVSTTEKRILDRTPVRKGRLTVGETYNPTLAWSSQRAPSMYLLPSKVVGLQSAMDDKPVIGNTDNSMLKLMKTSGIRITNKEREDFEKLLDAEYVPFSFQDVRTNEVISFHAFLSSLSDDYSAAYDSVEGFGRVEPIKIYKSTTRKIGMSFHIVSTSPEDFDHMWYKINKLLMFVYPQYTPGRDLISSEGGQTYQFKAPFSQQPGASPLVRIRLGNLIRSNYSKFALARLFGAADHNMKIPKNVADRTSTPIDTTGAWKEEADEASFLAEEAYDAVEELRDILKGKVPNITDLQTAVDNARVAREAAEKALAAAKKKTSLDDPYGAQTPEAAAAAAAKSTEEKALAALNSGTKAEALLAAAEAEVKRCEAAAEAAEAFADSFADNSAVKTTLDAFMDPDNNVIVKSFESAGGKGLAGFIESMNFDWYNQTTWDTDIDRTAPKMCKVTLSFSPIHDITPGLDQHGYNRAPVYPVGTYSKPKNS
jgi:hypothetical protein